MYLANLPRKYISELHGNFYLDECTMCKKRFVRDEPSKTMRLQKSSRRCPRERCRGHLRDCILDWNSKIPHLELRRSEKASKLQLHILIGSTAQLVPAKTMIFSSKRGKRYKLVVINLQPTQFDRDADLVIHRYADEVMSLLADELNLTVADYNPEEDPTKTSPGIEWKRT
jgi:mono-ADP-ribosyltransferase sirtuin 6